MKIDASAWLNLKNKWQPSKSKLSRFLHANFFGNNFDFWPKVRISTKISIFDQNFDVWPKFRCLTKISIFDQNFDFCPNFRFLTKIYFFCQKKPVLLFSYRCVFRDKIDKERLVKEKREKEKFIERMKKELAELKRRKVELLKKAKQDQKKYSDLRQAKVTKLNLFFFLRSFFSSTQNFCDEI